MEVEVRTGFIEVLVYMEDIITSKIYEILKEDLKLDVSTNIAWFLS